MLVLEVPFCGAVPFSQRAVAPIAHYAWEQNGFAPEARAMLCYDRSCLSLQMEAREFPPRAQVQEDDGPVWTDSCLEVFLRPEGEARYLNLEINPLGFVHMALGLGREDRRSLTARYKPFLCLRAQIEPPCGWGVSFCLPFAMLCEIFSLSAIPKAWRVNFYKCGDLTERPHYGMWNPVRSPAPDFHRPESFGLLRLLPPGA